MKNYVKELVGWPLKPLSKKLKKKGAKVIYQDLHEGAYGVSVVRTAITKRNEIYRSCWTNWAGNTSDDGTWRDITTHYGYSDSFGDESKFYAGEITAIREKINGSGSK